MAWGARDGAVRSAATRRTSTRRGRRWLRQRAALAEEVTTHGFSAAIGAYTRSYGSSDVDAATLVLPLLGLEDPTSPRVVGTIAAIRRDLDAGGGLLYRYPPGRDGLPGTEGAFLPCSFWLVQALARSGRAAEARDLFETLLALATPLGLYAEELDPQTGAPLGNFPQALTHAAVVQAALALRAADRAASIGRDDHRH
jgi:GH15 family glucan-1,4-alpha-glucosidase